MADSEVWTTEDIDDIDSVIQLKPHQKDVEYTTVTKTSDGNDLVSIDELYEKTGQESIDKIIEGFNSLITRNKLAREHGVLLKVEGAESWMELPDRMNAVKGGENFITAIGKTFVDIIMAIVNFIKGICNWIWARLKSLFGFAKTEEEVRYLCQKSDDFKKETVKVFEAVGVRGFNPDELIKELPDNMMPSETMMTLRKSKFAKIDDVLKNYSECHRLNDKAIEVITAVSVNIGKANDERNRVFNYIRKVVNSGGPVSLNDIASIKGKISEIAKQYLDPTAAISSFKDMAEAFYGIPSAKLGADTHIETLKEKIKNEVENIKIEYNKKLYNEAIDFVKNYEKITGKKLNTKLSEKTVNTLKMLVTKNDATLIANLAKGQQDESINLVYLEYTKAVKELTTCMESLSAILAEVKLTLASVVKFYSKTNTIVCALATHDLEKLTKEVDALKPEDRDNWNRVNPNINIFHFKTLNEQFLKEHPNGHLEKQTSDAIAAMISSEKGKGVLRSFGNYMEGLKR